MKRNEPVTTFAPGRKVTTGRPRSDGELISGCGSTKLETNEAGNIVWHDGEGELDTYSSVQGCLITKQAM